MIILRCKMCGGDLAYTEGSTVCECEYCGSVQTVLTPDSEKKTNLFNRANRLRMNSEFDKAQTVYEQIVADFPEEAESYWGLCLCKYGIEYVDDPASGRKMPTCHRTVPTSIFDEPDFENVMEYADSVAKSVYRAEAKEIERVQRRILEIAQSEDPYDVFICYKETDEDGGRTEDSVLAQELYDALTEKGLKVFFSRVTLESKLGTEYEPYIYAALSSAKVMLAVGTDFDYFNAVWVKNEWSRYLAMMKTDRKKSLIPCYKGIDAYDLPREFKNLQAQDMGKLGWLQDVTRGVLKLCGKGAEQPGQTAVQQTVVREVVRENSNADNLMKRVRLFLEDGDFEQAGEYVNKVLDADAEYAPAYAVKVLLRHKMRKEDDLSALCQSLDTDTDWQKALRFANPQQRQEYEAVAKAVNDNVEKKLAEEEQRKKEKRYKAALASMEMGDYARAVVDYYELGEFRDSRVMFAQCKGSFLEQYIEREIVKAKDDIRLTEFQSWAKAAEQQWFSARNGLNKAEKEESDVIRYEAEIVEEFRNCSAELNNLHGLFTGGKKRELTAKLEELKQEWAEISQRRQQAEKVFARAKDRLKIAEEERKAARKAAQIEIEACWTDEEIVKRAVAREGKLKPYKTAGSYVTYGTYPQTEAGNDSTPIEWLALEYDAKNNKTLLISRYGLDCKNYNGSLTDVTWETCSLRTWLNDEFLNNAFSKAEQGAILTTDVDNSKSQGYYSTDGGVYTQDKIFLLSYAEAWKYFKNDEARKCQLTAYAVKQNSYKSSNGNCWWWLRSPGSSSSSAARVNRDGARSYLNVYSMNIAVRPAFWLDLSSDIF